jgi:hypothetical protein
VHYRYPYRDPYRVFMIGIRHAVTHTVALPYAPNTHPVPCTLHPRPKTPSPRPPTRNPIIKPAHHHKTAGSHAPGCRPYTLHSPKPNPDGRLLQMLVEAINDALTPLGFKLPNVNKVQGVPYRGFEIGTLLVYWNSYAEMGNRVEVK